MAGEDGGRSDPGSAVDLGPLVAVLGRDESTPRQWGQATVLGGLLALFIAPGFGFPILSGGPRYGLFALAILAAWAGLTLLVKRLRSNQAVRLHRRGLIAVTGNRRRALRFDQIRRASFEPSTRALRIELGDNKVWQAKLPTEVGRGAVEHVRRGVEPARDQTVSETPA